MLLPVTLSASAAAAIIAFWLMIRVGQVRGSEKVSIGDGGNEKVIRRMRAHANFVESAPFVLILVAAIEMTGKGAPWLAYVAGIYMLGRVAHGIGMDGAGFKQGRAIGTIITVLTLLGLAIAATLITLGVI
ncbi:MAPEG family protein [Altererythrobacter confluentis]|uniref:MAPEG family protein n=1 Tax=Allopontixanthobacter confluentis TaxID=1849021 RepID=A0A6L7GFX6_9SPHN|nr:MAPEG family protein [Allopontixanthobacter confluentis]MXP14570.1 MAPEG family protein [Allopontixanthobacter confluentis]